MNFVVFVSQTKVQQPSIGEKYFKEQKRSNMKFKKKKRKEWSDIKENPRTKFKESELKHKP